MNLIGLTGLAGSGKTTAAMTLTRMLDYDRKSFADPIRKMLAALGVSEHMTHEHKNTPIPWLGNRTPREIMQTLGTDFGRDMLDQNVWVNIAEQSIKRHSQEYSSGIVFDDLRFGNEAELIRRYGGIVIKLEREGIEQMAHKSEAGVDLKHIDYIVKNRSGDVSQLESEVYDIVRNHFQS